MDLQLIGIIAVGGVFAIGLLALGIYLLLSKYINNKIPRPPKKQKNRGL